MNTFSVIIPTHNRNSFLVRAIKKTLSQKQKPKEIIIIDDTKNFNAKKIVNSFKSRRVLIKYINSKFSSNALISRNMGAKKSKGKYIAFLDDDDFWDKKYLSSAKKLIDKNNYDLLLFNTFDYLNKGNKKKKNKIPKKFNIQDYLHYNPGVLCSNIIIKKSVFKKLKGYDWKISGSADKDLFLRYALKYKNYHISDRYLVYLQNHSQQWSKMYKLILIQKILFFKKYLKFYLNFRNFTKFIKTIISFLILINKKNEH